MSLASLLGNLPSRWARICSRERSGGRLRPCKHRHASGPPHAPPGRRGTLTSVQPGSAFTAPPVQYVAAHDTAPPEHQVVKTDSTSILIRALQNRKAKEEAKRKAKAAGAAAGGGGIAAGVLFDVL